MIIKRMEILASIFCLTCQTHILLPVIIQSKKAKKNELIGINKLINP
jgi:hypothetical protein